MRATTIDKADGWRWRFALIPFSLESGPKTTWVWLEWYQSRFEGLYYSVRLAPQAKRNAVLEEAAEVLDKEAQALFRGGDQFDQDGDIYRIAGAYLSAVETVRKLKSA